VPALPAIAKMIRNEYLFSVGEDLGAKCREFWFYTGAGPSDADAVTLATTIATDFAGSGLLNSMNEGVALIGVKVTDLTSDTAAVGEWSGSYVGTNATGSLSAAACTLESLEIIRRFRGGHPRIYWPFGYEAAAEDAQTWSDDYLAVTVGRLLSWRNDWTTDTPATVGGVVPYAVSYYAGFTVHMGVTGRARNISTVRDAPVTDGVQSRILRKGIATQRRRLLHLA